MIRNWKKIRSCAVLLGALTVAFAGLSHNSVQAEELQNLQELEPEPALSAPLTLPVTGISGVKVTLPLHEGKPYIVHFWATWCLPCREELPQLVTFIKAHPTLPVIPVALDSGAPERVRDFLPRLHAEGLPIWTADRQKAQPFYKSVQSPGLPMTLLVDGRGEVRAISDGGVNWADPQAASKVETLLHDVQ